MLSNPARGRNLGPYVTLFVLLILAAANRVAAWKPKLDNGKNCTNHLQEIDKCGSLSTYSYTSPLNPYPLDAEQMRASCERISNGLKCLKTYGKCLSPFGRTSINAYSNSRSKHAKKLCTNVNENPKATEFWKAAECINKNKAKKDLMIKDEKELISIIQVLAVSTNMKFEDRLYYFCCDFSDYKAKVLRDIEPECAKFRAPIEEMLGSIVGEMLNNSCAEKSRLEKVCPKLAKLSLPKEFKPESLSKVGLDLVVSLGEQAKNSPDED